MDVADYLTGMAKEGKAQMARAMRSLLRDVFAEAQPRGWADANPVEATKAARVSIKRERADAGTVEGNLRGSQETVASQGNGTGGADWPAPRRYSLDAFQGRARRLPACHSVQDRRQAADQHCASP